MPALRKRGTKPRNANPSLALTASELYQLYTTEFDSELGFLSEPHRLAGEALRRGDVLPLKRLLEVSPEFRDHRQLRCHFQALGFLQKQKLKGADPRGTAVAKFRAAEEQCRRVNRKFRYYARFSHREPETYRIILSRARAFIREVLGELTPNSFEKVLDLARPGPGVSIGSLSPTNTGWEYKYGPETDLACTPAALPYARLLVETSQVWCDCVGEVCYKLVPGNRVSWVPKNTFTDRSIAVEPALNVQLQLGVGRWIASRLRGFGIDLEDQGRNQRAARDGARNWDQADPWVTIDLSSASDTVSIELVRRLLPSDWFGLCDDLRSPVGRLRGEEFVYEKFSSMGNGFTFPLETLIFWAIARAVGTWCHGASAPIVYGDDIIVRRGTAAMLLELLRYCGFKANVSKTFLFGPFRESCGVNVYGETDVTPIRLSTPNLRPSDVYHLLNKSWLTDDIAKRLFRALRGEPILRGPCDPDNPNGHIWTSGPYGGRRDRDLQVRTYRTLSFRPLTRPAPAFGAYVATLAGATRGERRLRDAQSERRMEDDRRSSVPRRGVWFLATRYSRA